MDHALEIGSTFFQQQVRAEIFKLQVRDEARRQYAEETSHGPLPAGMLAYDPLPPEPPELIPGLLLAHGATAISGLKETGKSLIALEIQSSLLTGQPLWGEINPNSRITKTVHFLGEHTAPTLMGLFRRTQLPNEGELKIFGPEHLTKHKLLMSSGILQQASVDFYKKLAAGAGLVVFDPLSSFMQGQAAENDNAPMRGLVNAMIDIAESTGAACLVLAHQGKPQLVEGKMVKRYMYATRGASSSEDAFTAVHYLDHIVGQKIKNEDMYELRPIHFKGIKPAPFRLMRDPKTCRNTTLTGTKSFHDDLRREANDMIGRFLADNTQVQYRTALHLAAVAMGVADETIERRVGLKQDISSAASIEDLDKS